MIQITVIKISGYGPWTLTLGSDREHRLQMLQASLYGRLQGLFSERDSLVFMNRHDEYFAITNGITPKDHASIQEDLVDLDVRLVMSIGCAETPYGANLRAFEARSGAPLDAQHMIYANVDDPPGQHATILHMDVEDLTSSGLTRSPYEISCVMARLYAQMSEFFMKRDAMAFFLGGDNFMVAATGDGRADAEEFVGKAGDNLVLNCGIGRAGTGRQAARLATRSLDEIRQIRDSGAPKPQVHEAC